MVVFSLSEETTCNFIASRLYYKFKSAVTLLAILTSIVERSKHVLSSVVFFLKMTICLHSQLKTPFLLATIRTMSINHPEAKVDSFGRKGQKTKQNITPASVTF